MHRTSGSVVALAVALAIGGMQWAGAVRAAAPARMQTALPHVEFGRPTLAPFAYTVFCLRYEMECRPRRSFRGGPIRLTEQRWVDLQEVNRAVNLAIVPERNLRGLAGEEWILNPDRGDCNDYAVSKRHALLERGWPARTLLLSEVIVGSGEHHLVLLVRTRSGNLVLDNLAPQIKRWSRVPYRWVRVQMPSDHGLWAVIGQENHRSPMRFEETARDLRGKKPTASPGP